MSKGISSPLLSEELKRFADELEFGGLDKYEWSPEGIAEFTAMLCGAIRIFGDDARLLEAHVQAADAVANALKADRAIQCRIDLLAAGLSDGKITILHPPRLATEAASDGDAA